MIYLDNSATTNPKPLSVIKAVDESLTYYCANPGRSGHKLSMLTAQKVFDCRSSICRLFNIDDENKVVFTSSCTHAVNIVIKGLLKSGDHCVISSLEHNCVVRPLEKLKEKGVTYSVADVDLYNDDATVNNFRNKINERTKLIVCTHASNVFGAKLPVERICALAHRYGILFCLDTAQSAGVFDIDIKNSGFDFVCCAGHKGLYGPMGIGVLVFGCDIVPDSLIEGGTGSDSQSYVQPSILPDRFESGTLNIPGICGLKKGIDFVMSKGIRNIRAKEQNHIKRLYNFLSSNNKTQVYFDIHKVSDFAPVLSFNIRDVDCESVAKVMSNKYNIALRSGLHCAILAHKYMKTEKTGTVRISPSFFTTEKDIISLINAIKFF